MFIYSIGPVAMVVFAIFYYRAGVFDDGSPLLWAALSTAISLLMLLWLKWGVVGVILGQIGLFVGITALRILRKS